MKKTLFLFSLFSFFTLLTALYSSCTKDQNYELNTVQINFFRAASYNFDPNTNRNIPSGFYETYDKSIGYDSLFLSMDPDYYQVAKIEDMWINRAIASSTSYFNNNYDSIDIAATPSYDGVQADGTSILAYLSMTSGDPISSLSEVFPQGNQTSFTYGEFLVKLNRAPQIAGNYRFILRWSTRGEWQVDTSDVIFIKK